MVERLESKREACEERLEVRNQDIAEKMQKQKEDAQQRFQQKQVVIFAKTTEWVDNKLEEHAKYKAKCEAGMEQGRQNLKEKSKSTGDIRKKAHDKAKVANERMANNRDEFHAALIERHRQADERREALDGLKIKNENDVHTFREIK